MAEGKKILLTIEGRQYLPDIKEGDVSGELCGQTDTSRNGAEQPIITGMQVEALYYKRDDSHYLFYEEQPEGFPAPVKTRLKFRHNYMELTRQGELGCRMVFEAGKIHRTDYPTPYGRLVIDVVTDSVRLEQREKGNLSECCSLMVEYRLENEGQLIGNYQLLLKCGN